MIGSIESAVLFVITAVKAITPLALMFSGACAWVASRWPQPVKHGFWRTLNKLVNIAGGNVMYATNAATDRRRFVRLGDKPLQPDIHLDFPEDKRLQDSDV